MISKCVLEKQGVSGFVKAGSFFMGLLSSFQKRPCALESREREKSPFRPSAAEKGARSP
jgi:hypothetical protein